MTKFLLGVAVGYVFSDMIDELIGRATFAEKASSTSASSEPEGESPMVSQP